MTLPKFALDYESCTTAELHKFASQKLNLKFTWNSRIALICALRDADKRATFRFLDLAPELRNLVYGELFTMHRDSYKSSCHPGIITSCRQIRQEAQGMLDADLTIVPQICGYYNRYNIEGLLHKHGEFVGYDKLMHMGASSSFDPAPELISWSPRVFEQRQLTVSVRLRDSDTINATTLRRLPGVNLLLHEFVSRFLASGCSLESLTLNLDGVVDGRLGAATLYDFLWPFTKLGCAETLIVKNVPTQVADMLRANMHTPEPSTSKGLQSLVERRFKLLHMLKLVAKAHGKKRGDELRRLFERKMAPLRVASPGLYTKEREEKRIAQSALVEDFLGMDEVVKVQAEMEETRDGLGASLKGPN